jgi:hypothetical protein
VHLVGFHYITMNGPLNGEHISLLKQIHLLVVSEGVCCEGILHQ